MLRALRSLQAQQGRRVFGWGAGGDHQLATEYPHDGLGVPQEIESLRGVDVVQVAAGWLVSYALSGDGTVFGWGSNKYVQLTPAASAELRLDELSHVRQPAVLKMPAAIRQIGAGRAHTVFVDEAGGVHTIGSGELGQLGNGVASDGSYSEQLQRVEGALSGQQVQSVAVGFDHTLALTRDGRVFAWGVANEGQLGRGDVEEDEDAFAEPQPVDVQATGEPLPPIVKVAAGTDHSAVLSADGHLYLFGSNCVHQLGIGSSDDYSFALLPVRLHGELDGRRVVDVALGGVHSFALTDTGDVYSWGWNDEGRLGLPKIDSPTDTPEAVTPHFVSFPRRHQVLSDLGIKSLHCGGAHTIAVTHDDQLYAFGFGMSGRLGLGHNDTVYSPAPIMALNSPRNWDRLISISTGVDHNLIVVD